MITLTGDNVSAENVLKSRDVALNSEQLADVPSLGAFLALTWTRS